MTLNATESYVRVCQKLDELRFTNTVNWGILGKNIFKNLGLKPSTRLLLFWLCSIIDQFYGYVTIWTNGERAMLKLIQNNPKSFSEVDEKIRNQRRDSRGNVTGDIFIDGRRFRLVRDDYRRIKNTFAFLAKCGGQEIGFGIKFVDILGELIVGCQGKNGIQKMAYLLDGWMFSNTPVSSDPTLFELQRFREKPRKRLWMFIMFLRRDPAILNLFRKALLEVYGDNTGNTLFSIWNDEDKFDPKEIELPGDMWNQRLFKALLSELPTFIKQKPKQAARQLALTYNVSPSIFDVTFELGANKCRTMECIACPFGDNQLCHKGQEEFCSVEGWLFPYYEKGGLGITCRPHNCPIAEDLGKNLCTREINREITH
jgi:hypothetical protein